MTCRVASLMVVLVLGCDREYAKFDADIFYPEALRELVATAKVASELVPPQAGSCDAAPIEAAKLSTGKTIALTNTKLRIAAADVEGEQACLVTRIWDDDELSLIGSIDGPFSVRDGVVTDPFVIIVADAEETLALIEANGRALSLPAPTGGCSSKSHVFGFGPSGAWLFSARGKVNVDVPPPVACSFGRDGRFHVTSRDDDGHHLFVVTPAGEVESHGPTRAIPSLHHAKQATTPRGIRVVLDDSRDALVFYHPDGSIDDRGPGSARGNQTVFALDSGVIVLAHHDGRIDVTRARW
jgi:hypothetical protein